MLTETWLSTAFLVTVRETVPNWRNVRSIGAYKVKVWREWKTQANRVRSVKVSLLLVGPRFQRWQSLRLSEDANIVRGTWRKIPRRLWDIICAPWADTGGVLSNVATIRGVLVRESIQRKRHSSWGVEDWGSEVASAKIRIESFPKEMVHKYKQEPSTFWPVCQKWSSDNQGAVVCKILTWHRASWRRLQRLPGQ